MLSWVGEKGVELYSVLQEVKKTLGVPKGIWTWGTRAKLLPLATYGYFNKGHLRLFSCLWGLSQWGFKSRKDEAGSTYQEGSMLALSKQIDSKLA